MNKSEDIDAIFDLKLNTRRFLSNTSAHTAAKFSIDRKGTYQMNRTWTAVRLAIVLLKLLWWSHLEMLSQTQNSKVGALYAEVDQRIRKEKVWTEGRVKHLSINLVIRPNIMCCYECLLSKFNMTRFSSSNSLPTATILSLLIWLKCLHFIIEFVFNLSYRRKKLLGFQTWFVFVEIFFS